MVLHTCPHCATEFETAGHPDPSRLTCFNCNQRAEDPPDTAFDRMEGLPPPMEPQVWYTLDEAARYLRLPPRDYPPIGDTPPPHRLPGYRKGE